MTVDDWGTPILSPEEQEAERADMARLLGYGDCDDLPPMREHCPTHGAYLPLDPLQPDCHWCIADDDDWHQRNDRYHILNRKFNEQ